MTENILALISRSGNCSFAEKILSAEIAGYSGAVIFTTPSEALVDMTCDGPECNVPLSIPATMIPYENALKLIELNTTSTRRNTEVFVRLQHTPSRNFFLGIDEQGKLQEAGWLLYPSMVFLSYQAKWFNYFTNLMSNLTASNAQVITVFNATKMQGEKGVQRIIDVPPQSELQTYEHTYLDMSLSCPGKTDFTCPPWDHTVQLYLCCDKSSPLCGLELGRWITPFRRRIGRWLTEISEVIEPFRLV